MSLNVRWTKGDKNLPHNFARFSMPRLRQHERYRTVGMVQAGMRQIEVANHFGCSKHKSRQTLTAKFKELFRNGK